MNSDARRSYSGLEYARAEREAIQAVEREAEAAIRDRLAADRGGEASASPSASPSAAPAPVHQKRLF